MSDSIDTLKSLAKQVRNAKEIGENTAERVGRVLEGILDLGFDSAKFLSKTDDDTADGLITFVRGLVSKEIGKLYEGAQFGENYVGGMSGSGGYIGGNGKAELRALTLWEWLEVPELRYNRAEVKVGDEWNSPGGGIIEDVDTANKVVKLKLESGEIGLVANDDLCMGIWHDFSGKLNDKSDSDDGKNNRSFAGFYTSYFRITEVDTSYSDNSHFKYEMRAVSSEYPVQKHPAVGMHFVCFGNISDENRRASKYSTRTYTRYLKNVMTWEFGVENIAAQFGDCSNLSVFGLSMSGYSGYLKNIYFSGKIEQFVDVADWMVVEQSLNGMMAPHETENIKCVIYDAYGRDVTSDYSQFALTRESGDAASDNTWNMSHTNVGSSFNISFDSDLNVRNNNTVSVMFNIVATKNDGVTSKYSLSYE